MKSSTRIGISGARPHIDRADTKPVDSKILMFVLRKVNRFLNYKFYRKFNNEYFVCLYARCD